MSIAYLRLTMAMIIASLLLTMPDIHYFMAYRSPHMGIYISSYFVTSSASTSATFTVPTPSATFIRLSSSSPLLSASHIVFSHRLLFAVAGLHYNTLSTFIVHLHLHNGTYPAHL